MFLLLTAVDKKGNVGTFSYQPPNLETAFDILSQRAAEGYYLVKAQLFDDKGWIILPVEAFDDRSISPAIGELERQWQQLLHRPVDIRSVFYHPDNDDRIGSLGSGQVHCLIYLSTYCGRFLQTDLMTILRQSRSYNRRMHITGVLLYSEGTFVQVLEGERRAVESLFDRIRQDTRHIHVTCVLNQAVPARLFTRWSMAYETLTVRQLEEVQTLISLELAAELSADPALPSILKTLHAFYQTNRCF